MIVPSKSVFAMALSVVLASAVVNGHGYMSAPEVTFLPSAGDMTQFIGTIEASATGWSGKFNGAPDGNAAAFSTAFASSDYKSLKEVITDLATVTVNGATLTCGSCDPNETPQPLPDQVEWAHSGSEGFTPSHQGPCEVWCDDTRVFQDDNCAADYTSAPAKMPYDRDACMGSSTLTFYWLALHSSTWQVYINCAPLEASTSTGSGSPPSSQTPTVTTAAPSPATTAPSTPPAQDSGSEDCDSLDMAEGEEDCDSLDMADGDVAGEADTPVDDSECGSLDMADDSECGSLDMADDSECGSLEMAEGDNNTNGEYAGGNIDFSTFQGQAAAGTVAPGQK